MCSDKIIRDDDITFKSVRQEDNIAYKNLTLKEFEANIIEHYLKMHNNNVLLVAEILDIGKSTIYRHIKSKKDARKA